MAFPTAAWYIWETCAKLRRTSLAASLVLITAVACGSGDSPTTAPAPPTTAESTVPPTTVAAKPAVVLDNPGAQPRQPLVLRLAPGSTSKSAMVNQLTLKITIDGQTTPTGVVPGTRMVMEDKVDRVDADGTAHLSTTFVDVSTVATPGADPEVVRGTQAAISSLKGIRSSRTVDVRGNVSDVSIDSRGVSDPAIKNTIDSMTSQVGNLATPFPSEPVGVGARWTVKGTAMITGLQMTTTTRYTLKSRTGDRYELDMASDAMATPGPAPLPNLPAGATASVTSFSMRNTGQISGDLTRHMPVKSSNKGTGDANFEMSVGSQKGRLVQQMTIEITVSPA